MRSSLLPFLCLPSKGILYNEYLPYYECDRIVHVDIKAFCAYSGEYE